METSKENSVSMQTSLLNGVEKKALFFSHSKATGMDNVKHSDIHRIYRFGSYCGRIFAERRKHQLYMVELFRFYSKLVW